MLFCLYINFLLLGTLMWVGVEGGNPVPMELYHWWGERKELPVTRCFHHWLSSCYLLEVIIKLSCLNCYELIGLDVLIEVWFIAMPVYAVESLFRLVAWAFSCDSESHSVPLTLIKWDISRTSTAGSHMLNGKLFALTRKWYFRITVRTVQVPRSSLLLSYSVSVSRPFKWTLPGNISWEFWFLRT